MLKLIGASTIVALLVLSGCGGGDNSGGGGDKTPGSGEEGIKIPDTLTKKADLNESTAGSYIHTFDSIQDATIKTLQSKLRD